MADYQIKSGAYTLAFTEQNGSYGLAIFLDDKMLFTSAAPCFVFIKTPSTYPAEYSAAYASVELTENGAIACGKVVTEAGTALSFCDTYTAQEADGFLLSRKVSLANADGFEDTGFATKFYLQPAWDDATLTNTNCFAPGVWYLKNDHVPPHFMGYQKQLRYHWMFETQYGLPMFAIQNPETGYAVSLSRPHADITMRDMKTKLQPHMVDETYTFGGIGVSTADGLSLDYLYPGAHGTTARKLPDGFSLEPEYNNTYHPVREGYTDTYEVAIDLMVEPDYAAMMKALWRKVYDRIGEPIVELDNEMLFRNCMKLLTIKTRKYGESYGLPFSITLPSGEPMNVAYQFGFVGQQPNIGYQLLRYGFLENDAEALEKGRGIIDFWATTSLSPSGAPYIWYNPGLKCYEEQRPFWIRMIGDGMEGILDAYVFAKKQGEDHPQWLEYCKTVAAWLVKVQNEDGSWHRSYDAESRMLMESKANTSNVVRFLVQLYLVTKDEALKTAAIKAGEWSLANITANFEYRGGTCDNNDILDNESGIYAMFAYLALYDLTKEDRWMVALKKAADYTETWTYAWSFPVYVEFPNNPLSGRNISGQSLIATGHSGADVYMAACPYIYYRLYLLTDDEHYLEFARFLHKNSKQCTDWDGSYGYAIPGLCHESAMLYEQTYQSVYHWLPWCTYVQVDPISRMVDTFGVYEIDEAQKKDKAELKLANDIYASYAE